MSFELEVAGLVRLPSILGKKYTKYFNAIFSKGGVSPKFFSKINEDLDSSLEGADKELLSEIEIFRKASAEALKRYSSHKSSGWLVKFTAIALLILVATFSINRNVVATTTGTPSQELWYSEALVWVQTFYQWVEVINGAMQTINGGIQYLAKQADNNASALLDLQRENYNKSQTARGTIAEKTLSYMEEQRKAWNRLSNASGSSVCVGDAAYGGLLGMRIEDYEWVDEREYKTAYENLSNNSKNKASENGKTVAKVAAVLDSKEAKEGDKYLAKRSTTVVNNGRTVKPGSKEEESAKTAIDLYSGSPAGLPKGDVRGLVRTEKGLETLGTIGARYVRRDTAVKAISSETARNVGSEDLYNTIMMNAEGLLEPPPNENGEPSQSNNRNTMLGEAIITALKRDFPDQVMSSNDTLRFLTDIRLTPQYSEFIRSSGPVATPLIRDVIHNQIIALQQRNRMIDLQEKSISIMASILLEIQDDPKRVKALAEDRRSALGAN